jgi:hypothetical protein
MPVVSRFYGIIIAIYYDDHPPPHFHARYGSFQAKFDIRSGASIIGELPPRALGLVQEWRALHQEALMRNWELACAHQPLSMIEPLE